MVQTEERFNTHYKNIYGGLDENLKRESLVGNRYGKLVVNEMMYNKILSEHSKQARTYCICQCDCGNIVTVAAYRLKSGKKQSCGCDSSERRSRAYRYNLANKRFGRLTAVETLYGSKVRCKCDCGKETIVSTSDLVSGHTKSCGCLQKYTASRCNTKDFTGLVSKYGVKFIEQFAKNKMGQWLWKCRCGLCGNEFVALPAKVMNGHITSCGCRRQSSREQLIADILKREMVSYISQYSIPACRDKQVLLFDFAIFKDGELDSLIEYDGKQHFYPIDFYGGKESFDKSARRDKIKNEYCKNNNICLYRLPYTMTDEEIEQKVMSIIYP